MIVRAFRPAELPEAVGVLRQALALPGLDATLLARDFLLAPGFAMDDLLVAEVGGAVAGVLLAARRDDLAPPGTGWIAAFGVRPESRGQGIGTALLATAIEGLRRDGVGRIDVADVPVRYLLPGVDREAFPAAYRLLRERFGFVPRDEVASMWVDLAALPEVPADASIRACQPGELPLLRDFLCREFDAGWWAFFQRSLAARLGGDPEPSAVLCHWRDGVPLGAVHFRGHRFGPLAVGAALRGRGIGARLTRAALARMRGHGMREASFRIGAEAVQPFYARLGFRVLRRFGRLTL